MKNSHLLIAFGVVFALTTLITNVALHRLDSDRQHDTMVLGVSSVASARKHFRLSAKNNSDSSSSNNNKNTIDDKNKINDSGNGHITTNSSVRPIELLLPQKDIDWIRRRNQSYFDWYMDIDEKYRREKRWSAALTDPHKHEINATTGFTNYDEDRDEPWMDFLIAGHPKTGTTTLVANLAKVAPMKVKDFCAPKPSTLLHFLLDKWQEKFPEIMDGPNKYVPDKSLMLVGSKCPQFIGSPELLSRFTVSHPRLKLIIGVRHPVEWFNSFIRMGHQGNLYRRMKICPHFRNIHPISGIPGGITSDKARGDEDHEVCINECRCGTPICFHRARLHIGLARIGKTDLSAEERNLLAPEDPDGGVNLFNTQAKNPIFVYDQNQMKEDSYWDELAAFLGLNYIPNEHYHSSRGRQSNITLCTPFYDEFRSKIMEHSYNMSVWLEDYFLPLGLDPNRPDVVIANTASFREQIQTYKIDPCGRLERNDEGRYVLNQRSLSSLPEHQTTFELHADEAIPCPSKFRKQDDEDPDQKKGSKNRKGGRRRRRGNRSEVPKPGKLSADGSVMG